MSPHRLQTKQNIIYILSSGSSLLDSTIWTIPNSILDVMRNLYLITIDDSPTFVVPNTMFGMGAAMTSSLLTGTDDTLPALQRVS
jgi:hypothetical protein